MVTQLEFQNILKELPNNFYKLYFNDISRETLIERVFEYYGLFYHLYGQDITKWTPKFHTLEWAKLMLDCFRLGGLDAELVEEDDLYKIKPLIERENEC